MSVHTALLQMLSCRGTEVQVGSPGRMLGYQSSPSLSLWPPDSTAVDSPAEHSRLCSDPQSALRALPGPWGTGAGAGGAGEPPVSFLQGLVSASSYRGSLTRALFPRGPCCCVFPACVLSCWRLYGLRGTRQGCGVIWGPGREGPRRVLGRKRERPAPS